MNTKTVRRLKPDGKGYCCNDHQGSILCRLALADGQKSNAILVFPLISYHPHLFRYTGSGIALFPS